MFILGAETKPNIAAESVTESIDLGPRGNARFAMENFRRGEDFAATNAAPIIGFLAREKDIKRERLDTRRGSKQYSNASGHSAFAAETQICASSISTISIREKRNVRRTGITRPQSEFPSGKPRWIICRFFAQIAIALRHGKIGAAETAKPPKQEELL
jgi:hypothetical protein